MEERSAYCLKNGILYIGGEAAFGIGSHYYPSYHPKKVPVPENGDRIGEMKRDFDDMKAAHVNIVRTAAIGNFSREGGETKASFPLGEAIAKELGKRKIALVVRLNGYDNGLNEYPDEKMLNENGEPIRAVWSQFITNSVCHAGAKADNEKVTELGAEFFGKFGNVAGFQIFNEPAFPCDGFYDYNESTAEAYRRYLEKIGAKKEDCTPPRRRPTYAESPENWIRWRLFNAEKFNDYLNFLSAAAKRVKPGAETFTCMTCCPVQIGSSMRGADYFRVAEKMDIVGITLYLPCAGAFYYEHARVMDYAESAAASFGKHFWLIEYNAKCDLSARQFEAETYAAIGSGAKGIMYYQWRGDYVFGDAPEPDGYGIVYNDRSPTPKYASAMKMHDLLYRIGGRLVGKERVRQGIGILHSEHANAYFDAVCNGGNKEAWSGKEENIFSVMSVYRKFKREFISLCAVRGSELNDLPFSLGALIVPEEVGISEEEKAAIGIFEARGGKAFYYDKYLDCFKPTNFSGRRYEAYEIADTYGKKIARASDKKMDLKFLEDENEYAIAIVDFAEEERVLTDFGVELLADTAGESVLYCSGDGDISLPVISENGKKKIVIDKLRNGGVLFVKKR